MRTLVLKTADGELALEDLIIFGTQAVKNGRKRGDKVSVIEQEDGELQFTIQVNDPEPEPPKPKRTITKKTVKQKKEYRERVEQQIAEHKEKKARGEQVAYVPPVAGTPKQKKVKCPVCNWKKPVVTIAGTKFIKPHVRNGEECPGGSTQV